MSLLHATHDHLARHSHRWSTQNQTRVVGWTQARTLDGKWRKEGSHPLTRVYGSVMLQVHSSQKTATARVTAVLAKSNHVATTTLEKVDSAKLCSLCARYVQDTKPETSSWVSHNQGGTKARRSHQPLPCPVTEPARAKTSPRSRTLDTQTSDLRDVLLDALRDERFRITSPLLPPPPTPSPLLALCSALHSWRTRSSLASPLMTRRL